jgi:cytochrome c553
MSLKVPAVSFFMLLINGLLVANPSMGATLDGAQLFKDRTCTTCHGKDGNTPILPNYPSIGGQSTEYLLQQLTDIKSGARSNGQSAAMQAVMHLVSDEEMEAIAAYVSTLAYEPGRAVSKIAKEAAEPATNTEPAAAAEGIENKMTGQGGKDSKVWMADNEEREEAMRLEADHENGIEVYEVCAGCHLTEGWGKPDGTFPQLAGQSREVLIKQLADIRAKNRDNPTMYPFALPESIGGAQSIADVTEYISKLPMNPEPGLGEWEEGTAEYAQGQELYANNCVECHGENGEGKAGEFYPLIQGQHYNYMLRQFEWIRDGKRRNANPDMIKQIQEFSDQDMAMVINFVSRIKPPADRTAPSADWLNPDYD